MGEAVIVVAVAATAAAADIRLTNSLRAVGCLSGAVAEHAELTE